MSLDLQPDEHPLTDVKQLVESFSSAEKPASSHRVGLEHEKLVYPVRGPMLPVPYEGAAGISALFEKVAVHGYTPFREAEDRPVIALQRGMETISLEPGGQLELSGTAFQTAREAHEENLRHLGEVKAAAGELGLRLVALGYRPFETIASMPWMPKTRYKVMRTALPKRGRLALNMMLMTATGQVSLDWTDEADCARKVTATARMSPLLVALYANSPIAEGKPTGLMSFRSRVWNEVDPTRCGYLPAMLDGSFSYRAYVEWALDAPLLFLRRNGEYLHPELSFRQLLRDGYEGRPATVSDWTDHLSTLFPEVRIKRVMEVRAADCGSAAMTGALVALMRGALYEPTALSELETVLPKHSFEDHLAQHALAQKEGLRAPGFVALARDVLAIARGGLKRLGDDDPSLLDALDEVVASGRSPAEQVLKAFEQNGTPEGVLPKFAL